MALLRLPPFRKCSSHPCFFLDDFPIGTLLRQLLLFSFQLLMVPFIRPEVFPTQLLPIIANHFKNPKASSSTDARLSIALKAFDEEERQLSYVYELPTGSVFRLYNSKLYKKGNKKVKRYECVELSTGRVYLFQPNAEVELVQDVPR